MRSRRSAVSAGWRAKAADRARIVPVVTLFVVLLGLLAMRIPVYLAMGVASLVYFLQTHIPLAMLAQRATLVLDSFPLVAIPLFMLAGRLMNVGGVTRRIYAFCHDLVGFIPGGLGHVNVLGSLVFAGMSGSALADLGGLGQIEIKAMLAAGYDRRFTLGVTLASSILGPVIPPSIPAVIYAMNADVSVTALFLAGIGPGLLIAAVQMMFVWLIAVRRNFPREPWPTVGRLAHSGVAALPALLAPLILVGGMTLGVFTPTEAATVAVAYSLLLGLVVYQELTLREAIAITVEVGQEMAALTIIIAMGLIFGWILTVEQIPQSMAAFILQFAEQKALVLLGIDVLVLFLGCFLEGPVLLLVLPPILVPPLARMGVDPIHFGIVLIIAVGIGLYIPPLGVALYAMQRFTKMEFGEVVRAALPWLLPLVVALLIVTYVPWLALFVPRAFGF
jgi:tripartite ATP-independent transporter DctM subunit